MKRAELFATLPAALRIEAPDLFAALERRADRYPDDPRRVAKVDLVNGPSGWEIRVASVMAHKDAARVRG